MAHLEKDLKNLLMAGIGAAAIGYEKAQSLMEELIRRGAAALAEGKVLNEELRRKARNEPCKPADVNVSGMPPEERAELLKKLRDLEDGK